jgi:GNAT superfamily N-acetyltransferase
MIETRRIIREEYGMFIDRLAEILKDCVEGGASVNFVLPFPIQQARAYWSARLEGKAANDLRLFGSFIDDELVGTVQLVLAGQPNGQHRAEISKMLVHRSARRKGLGRALLDIAEAEARQQGRTLLLLDTARDSAGEKLYRACGWQAFGVVDGYALNVWGKPEPAVFFSKVLT